MSTVRQSRNGGVEGTYILCTYHIHDYNRQQVKTGLMLKIKICKLYDIPYKICINDMSVKSYNYT